MTRLYYVGKSLAGSGAEFVSGPYSRKRNAESEKSDLEKNNNTKSISYCVKWVNETEIGIAELKRFMNKQTGGEV